MATLDNVTLTISLGLGSGPLAASPAWTDITPYVKSWWTARGRSSVLDQFDTGTGGILVENLDGRFDPINTSGAYYPNLKIGVPVRIQVVHSAVTYTLFRGVVDSYPIEYSNSGQYSQLEIPILDMTSLVAGTLLDGVGFSDENTATRVNAIFQTMSWPAAFYAGVVVDTGVATVASTLARGAAATDHIQDAINVEAGTFYFDSDGVAQFQERTAASGLASSATFGPGGGSEIPYFDFGRAYDRDQLANIVKATAADRNMLLVDGDRPDGETQTAEDSTSKTDNGPITLRIDAPFIDDTAAMNVAEWQVARLANTIHRVTNLTFDPDESPSLAWPQAAGLDLRDGVTVKFTPPGGGTAVNQLCSVEGIEHSVDDQEVWHTTLRLWPLTTIETQSYWILGTSQLAAAGSRIA